MIPDGVVQSRPVWIRKRSRTGKTSQFKCLRTDGRQRKVIAASLVRRGAVVVLFLAALVILLIAPGAIFVEENESERATESPVCSADILGVERTSLLGTHDLNEMRQTVRAIHVTLDSSVNASETANGMAAHLHMLYS